MRRNTYFISDCHLGANYITDHRAHEARVVAFLDSIKHDAKALYLLGDILDYWYEYRTVVPRGHVRFFGKLAELADAGVRITWFTGNHDVWLFDYLSREIGLRVEKGFRLADIDGTRFLLSHGDDIPPQPPMYRFTRWCFHNRVCQWLYAAIHPRWTYVIAHGWSSHNRTSRPEPESNTDQERPRRLLEDYCRRHHAGHPEVKYYVFGHLHLCGTTPIADDAEAVFLGDWIQKDTYAVFDGHTMRVCAFDREETTYPTNR